MKKLFFAVAIAGLTFFSTSCKKETTCKCQGYEIQEDGTRIKVGGVTTRVVDSKDADCSQFNEYDDNLTEPDTEVICEEEVLD